MQNADTPCHCVGCLSNITGEDRVEISDCYHIVCPECMCSILSRKVPLCPHSDCGSTQITGHVYHRSDESCGHQVVNERAWQTLPDGSDVAVVEPKHETDDMAVASRPTKRPKKEQEVELETDAVSETDEDPEHLLPLDEVAIMAPDLPYWEQAWRKRLSELCSYKKRFGNIKVPRNYPANPPLGEWLHAQRQVYRKWREGKPSKISAERVKLLDKVGFADMTDWWNNPKYNDLEAASRHAAKQDSLESDEREKESLVIYSKYDERWHQRYEELKAYKREHGTPNVPSDYKANQQLARFCQTQRYQYKRLRDSNGVGGTKSSLTKEKINLLEALGFDWVIEDAHEVKWKQRFDLLKEYKEKNGDCLVPFKYPANKTLGFWVATQREDYKARIEGKKSPMTDERIEALEALGMVWKLRTRSVWKREKPVAETIVPEVQAVVPEARTAVAEVQTAVPETQRFHELQG